MSAAPGLEEKREKNEAFRDDLATDLGRWTLRVERGRQRWVYLQDDEDFREDELVDRYHLGLPTDAPLYEGKPVSVEEALSRGIEFVAQTQTHDGHWAGDYGGPMFLLPGFVFSHFVAGEEISKEVAQEIVRYLVSHQQADGGWGIHFEAPSTVFGTVLNYAVLRILTFSWEGTGGTHTPGKDGSSVPREQRSPKDALEAAYSWIQGHGGADGIPTWGKFWMCVLNLWPWGAFNALSPETILLPEFFPLHPKLMWAYSRTVYMPMTYLSAVRFTAEMGPELEALRRECFTSEWEKVNWSHAKNYCHPLDLYCPHSTALKTIFGAMNTYDKYVSRTWAGSWLREKGLKRVLEVMEAEDRFTNYICIGPVNKAMHMVVAFTVHGKDSQQYKSHVDRMSDYLWMGMDGMKVNGTNGSQLWDTSFMIQALLEAQKGGLSDPRAAAALSKSVTSAHHFIDRTQLVADHPNAAEYFRDPCKGGWPFSTHDIGWPVSDCTGEGLKSAVLCLVNKATDTPLSQERLQWAVDILIDYQNEDGGYATCEKTRGPKILEQMNASEVFADIIIDYSYTECTSTCVQALATFTNHFEYRRQEIHEALENANRFLYKQQRADGSFEGLWGVCFTYGSWFATEALRYSDPCWGPQNPVAKSTAEYILSVQQPCGGWGETFMSCVKREYVQHEKPQVVNTAWALLTLMNCGIWDPEVLGPGLALLAERQDPDGNFPQESICGVFNKNCMISYSNFKNVFPLWALARFNTHSPGYDITPNGIKKN